jgi:hypothetical protein
MGIEPTLFAWEAKVLPLNYTRLLFNLMIIKALAWLSENKKAVLDGCPCMAFSGGRTACAVQVVI